MSLFLLYKLYTVKHNIRNNYTPIKINLKKRNKKLTSPTTTGTPPAPPRYCLLPLSHTYTMLLCYNIALKTRKKKNY